MFVNILLLVMLTSGVRSLSLQEVDAEWDLFKVKFNKTYNTRKEEWFRYRVFTENLKEVFLHNIAADKGRYTYWLRINRFADMTAEEFDGIFANLKIKASNSKHEDKLDAKYQTKLKFNLTSLPEAVDWRSRNCVTPVKFQGNCRGCYAFAATGALEGLYCKTTGQLVSLSEQNIIDCTLDYGNDGCQNGMPDNAFDYATDRGIDTEQSYPYRGAMGQCELQRGTFGMRANDYDDVYPHGYESLLQKAVAEQGPVSVCIDTKGEGQKFQLYGHGVYDNTECSSDKSAANHALLVVGYDTTEDEVPYWIIKNSYGTCWGDDGYMKFIRNGLNTCGIATRASYPVM